MAIAAEKIEDRSANVYQLRARESVEVVQQGQIPNYLVPCPKFEFPYQQFNAVAQRTPDVTGHQLTSAATIYAVSPCDTANIFLGQGVEPDRNVTIAMSNQKLDIFLAGVWLDSPSEIEVLSLGGFPSFVQTKHFDNAYQRLGRTRRRDTLRQEHDFWNQQGNYGAYWLLKKLQTEASVEVLDAAAAVLRQMPSSVLPLLLSALRGNISVELAEVLVRALRREFLVRDSATHYADVVAAIERAAGSSDSEIREAAIETALKLKASDAANIVREAKQREHDPEMLRVIEAFEEELARIGPIGA